MGINDEIRGEFTPQAQQVSTVPDHEHSDVPIGRILLSLGLLAASTVAVHIALYFMFYGLESWAESRQPARHALAQKQVSSPEVAVRFPEPRLQVNDVRDMRELRERENILLHQYTFIDESAGRVSVPIERAKHMLLQQGIPSVNTAAPVRQDTTRGKATEPTQKPSERPASPPAQRDRQ